MARDMKKHAVATKKWDDAHIERVITSFKKEDGIRNCIEEAVRLGYATSMSDYVRRAVENQLIADGIKPPTD